MNNNIGYGSMNLLVVLDAFKKYCETPGISSGKAASYANSIQYLCDFFKFDHIDNNVLNEFRKIEQHISRTNDSQREELLLFLEKRGQKSYLLNGFIRAALKQFYPFWESFSR